MRTITRVFTFMAAFVAVAAFGADADAATLGAQVATGHGLLGAALATLALGVVVGPPVAKNSGILRYVFGSTEAGRNQLGLVTSAPTVIGCLAAAGDPTTPDSDNQVFGPSPGHGIVGAFDGALALPARASDLIVPASHAPFYIPGNTKVHAYFIPTDLIALAPVAVRTQVVTNPIYNGAVPAIVDPNGAQYLSVIRISVAVAVNAASTAGVLIVELQHSEHDIPGQINQDQNAVAGG